MPRPNGSQPIQVSKKQSLRMQANGGFAETQENEIYRISDELHRQREIRHAIEDRRRQIPDGPEWYGL